MTSRISWNRQAVRRALLIRRQLDLALDRPVCPFDLAPKLSVQVRFVAAPSMEGLYVRDPRPTILVSALRPAPRRTFTCAHELGHHAFGHAHRVDTRVKALVTGCRTHSQDEIAADRFAAELLLPSLGVRRAMTIRGIDPQHTDPLGVFRVACQFGVGYRTMINHLHITLRMIDLVQYKSLLGSSPRDIASAVAGGPLDGRLIAVDFLWRGIPIDVEAGDLIFLPAQVAIEGAGLQIEKDLVNGVLVRALRPGINRVEHPSLDWGAFVRVSRREFVGLSAFRHLEEADEEDED